MTFRGSLAATLLALPLTAFAQIAAKPEVHGVHPASHDAWLASLHGKAAPVVGGLTGEQQFFLGYAQSEAGKSREAALRNQILTDPHSPSQYRADTVRNLDAWYTAFGIKPGQTLYLGPDQRVHIW